MVMAQIRAKVSDVAETLKGWHDKRPELFKKRVYNLRRLDTRDEPTWLAVYARLIEVLDSQALDSLKRAFGRWIYKSFIRRKRPGIRLPDIDDFHEVHVMLQQRVEQWNAEIREQGRLEGRQENQRSTALAMLQRTALDEATIAELTGLSVEEVRALRNGPSHH
jgi:gamma-glutamylcysteine synthetase